MSKRPENAFWNQIAENMGGTWHAQRHEDKYSTGIPDVSFGMRGKDGWIELKVIAKPPVDAHLPFDLHALSDDQRIWLNARIEKGCPDRYFVFVRVEEPRAYVLWRWDRLRDYLGTRSYHQFTLKALGYWERNMNWVQFAEALSNPYIRARGPGPTAAVEVSCR